MDSKNLPNSPSIYDAMIIGGGLVGAMCGLAMAKGGLSVAVIDTLDPATALEADFDGRASALSRTTFNAFHRLGLWGHIGARAGIIEDIRVSDQGSLLFLHFRSQDGGSGPFGYMVENRVIREALFKEAEKTTKLDLWAPRRVACLTRTSAYVEAALTDGHVLRAKLLIGADGRGSLVRKHANIPLTRWPYHQAGIVCTVAHEKPHHNIAQEHFRPGGPFAILPLPNNRSSIVWTEKEDLAPILVALNDDDFLDELKIRFGDFLGELSLVGPRFCYPLSLQFAKTSTAQRLALVGDAYHGMHPIAGQGFNMGARDACALAELAIDAHRLGLDIGTGRVLEDYERWRRFDNHLMLAATDGLTKLFSNDIRPIKWARDIGLSLVNEITPLKKFFTRQAMGMSGELPKLMRELP